MKDEEKKMELKAEELVAKKETVETGKVRIGKEVVTEQKAMDVPVTREEPYIERHPVEEREAKGEIGEGEITVPVREERAYAEKKPYVKEEVSIGKRRVEETQKVKGEVSREEPRLESDPDPSR